MPGPDRASLLSSRALLFLSSRALLFLSSRAKSRDLHAPGVTCVTGGRKLGPSGHEDAGAPDAVPPLAPTMSLSARGRRGTPQLDAHPSGGNSPQLSPFALAREPVVPATRFSLRLLRPSVPTPAPGGQRQGPWAFSRSPGALSAAGPLPCRGPAVPGAFTETSRRGAYIAPA